MIKLGEAPNASYGLHTWILDSTLKLLRQGLSKEKTFELVRAKADGKGRKDGLDREIRDAINGAINGFNTYPRLTDTTLAAAKEILLPEQLTDRRPYKGGVRRPPSVKQWKVDEVNERLVEKALRCTVPELNPQKISLGPLWAELNVPLWISNSIKVISVRPLDYWTGHVREDFQYIVPNPFVRCGIGGKYRTKENAAERMWIVVEFDHGTLEEQLRKLCWLDQIDPNFSLAIVVFSGNKSLHGWFPCYRLPINRLINFYRIATSIGADGAMASNVQVTRLPGGLNRSTFELQEVWHYDRMVIEAHNKRIRENRYLVEAFK
jgi:hypothetical protein